MRPGTGPALAAPALAGSSRTRNDPGVAGVVEASRGARRGYSALTAAVSAARPSFASAKSIPVLTFAYSSLSMPA